jgi:hypothetical protein
MKSSPLRMQKNSAGCWFLGNYVEVERQRSGNFDLAPLVDVMRLLWFRDAYSDDDLVHSWADLYLTRPTVPEARRWALAF